MKINKILFAVLFVVLVASSPFFANWGRASKGSVLSCAGYSVEIKETSAGLIQVLDNLNITSPQIIGADILNGCAVVVWNTEYLSTSQVIFKKLGSSNEIDLVNSNESQFWGYQYGSLQNNDPQKYHVMIVNGLEKDVFYIMRAVSRAYPSALPYISDTLTVLFTENKPDKPVEALANGNAIRKVDTPQAPKYDLEKFPISDSAGKDTPDASLAPLNNEDISGAITNADVKDADKPKINIVQNEVSTTLPDPDEKLVSVIGAANAADSLLPIWSKVKLWLQDMFAGDKKQGTDSKEGEGTADVPEEQVAEDKNTYSGLKDMGAVFSSIILPTFLILLTLLIAQKVSEKYFDFIAEKKLLLWMSVFVLASVVLALLKMVSLALVFVALFLLSLAWYLFDSAVNDMSEEPDKKEMEVETFENEQK